MPAGLPSRPPHWLPHEPYVTVYPETDDGFAEVTLELGGRIVYTNVCSDQASAAIVYSRIYGVICKESVGYPPDMDADLRFADELPAGL